MTQPPIHLPSIEMRAVMQHRAACPCGNRGEWTTDKEAAQAESNKHFDECRNNNK